MAGEKQSDLPSDGNGHDRCLVCGYKNPWSLGMRFERSKDDAVCGQFHAHDDLQGYEGMLHGGVLAALLDSAMVHCLFHSGIRAVTGDLHIRFVHPVSCRATVDVRAQIVSANSPIYRLEAEILEHGEVMAWGEATFMQRRRAKTESDGTVVDSGPGRE